MKIRIALAIFLTFSEFSLLIATPLNKEQERTSIVLDYFPITSAGLQEIIDINEWNYFKLLAAGELTEGQNSELDSLHNNIGSLARKAQNYLYVATYIQQPVLKEESKRLLELGKITEQEAQKEQIYKDFPQSIKAKCYNEYLDITEALIYNIDIFTETFQGHLAHADQTYAELFPRDAMQPEILKGLEPTIIPVETKSKNKGPKRSFKQF